jgi:hypothetical protein
MAKKRNKSRGLASIKKVFTHKKRYKTNKQRYPDDYFAAVYINKSVYNGVKIVAESEGLSKKAAVDKLLRLALSKYLGETLKEHLILNKVNQLLAPGIPKIPVSRAVKTLRKYAVEAGISEYRCKKWGL